MKSRKIIATLFIIIALIIGAIFFLEIEFPIGLEAYFKAECYNQFGPLALSIELLIGGFYLFTEHRNTNFALALFGFTVLLDLFFNLIGLFTSIVPTYAMVVFLICALLSLWIAFSNAFKLTRISVIGTLISFILGSAVELFFNYF